MNYELLIIGFILFTIFMFIRMVIRNKDKFNIFCLCEFFDMFYEINNVDEIDIEEIVCVLKGSYRNRAQSIHISTMVYAELTNQGKDKEYAKKVMDKITEAAYLLEK